jgi:hypothetical protein
MQSFFPLSENSWRGFLLAASCLLTISLAENLQLSDGVLRDSFHQGEYFAALPTLLDDHADFLPLTIHGALDYIPGLLARKLFGVNTYFFPTSFIYQLLNICAAVFFLAIVFELLRNRPTSPLVMFAAAVAAPLLVGYRDALLLLAIYLYLLIQRSVSSANFLLNVSFGLTVAFGLFWSYDRGLAGAFSLGLACLIHIYRDRRYLTSVLVFLAAAISFGYVWPPLSLGNYWENLRILAETSSQWSYAWEGDTVILAGFLSFYNMLAIWLLGTSLVGARFPQERFANPLLLITLSLFLFKVASNRADVEHILMGLWAPLLACVYWYSGDHGNSVNTLSKVLLMSFFSLLAIVGYQYSIGALIPIAVLVAAGLISISHTAATNAWANMLFATILAIPIFNAGFSIANGLLAGQYHWVRYFGSLPANVELVTDGVRWVSQELTNSGSRCVFDLSNHGVINGLTGLPACSRFTYLVYADQRYEQEIIESLAERGPKAIVFSSTDASFNIDGRTMHTRFPNLANILQSKYGNEKCSFGYCVRYLGETN